MKTGDLVALKSGGPLMTVNSLKHGDGLISCEWFAGELLKRNAFDRECLVTLDELKEGGADMVEMGTMQ